MGKAVPVALLLLFGAGRVAAADNLSDRFNDTFGDTPPAAAGTPPAEASPPAPAPATETPPPASATDTATPVVVPKKPKPRHTATAATPPAEDAVAVPPATPAVVVPKPPMKPVKAAKADDAVKAVGAAKDPKPSKDAKPSEPIAGSYQLNITWNALDPSWEGMYVTNSGSTPVSVVDVALNNRKECTLKPYSLDKIKQMITVQDAVKQWGHEAINLFGLPKMESSSILVPELPAALQSSGITPEEPKIKGGGRVAIFNGTKCDKVSEAKIDTDVGPIAIKFKKPYTGH